MIEDLLGLNRPLRRGVVVYMRRLASVHGSEQTPRSFGRESHPPISVHSIQISSFFLLFFGYGQALLGFDPRKVNPELVYKAVQLQLKTSGCEVIGEMNSRKGSQIDDMYTRCLRER